jgi:ATPase subunit of ABC transporter with duplicated ATPase domains
MGWAKMVQRLDQQEALRAGLAARPLTTKFVEKQLGDMGLEAEFATHSRIRGLSGGQKVVPEKARMRTHACPRCGHALRAPVQW